MEKRSPVIPLGIFLLIFLSVFLIREINITGRTTGNILINNNAPLLLTDPYINDSSPNTNSHIACIPGQYFDIDGHIKFNDYFRWYRNNLRIQNQFTNLLDLSLPGNGDANDVLRCSQAASDGFANSTWINSSAVTILTTAAQPTTSIPGNIGGTTSILGCTPNYSCSPWTSCINATQTRECIDLNGCEQTPRIESRKCVPSQLPAATSTIIEQKTEDVIEAYSILSIVIITLAILLFLILMVIAIMLSRKHGKPRKEPVTKEHVRSDLFNYIKQALDRGYSQEQIQDALLKAGWPRDMIQAGFEEVT